MQKSYQPEIIDSRSLNYDELRKVHRDLACTNRNLGNRRAIKKMLEQDRATTSVLDIGCGDGAMLQYLKSKLGVQVCGVELEPGATTPEGIPLTIADATKDSLPQADAAIAVFMAHHLTEQQLIQMIQNVGQYCKRFIILDLVRHPLPYWLFKLFIAPFVHKINAHDGALSVRRAYTEQEMNALVQRALTTTDANFEHTIAPGYIRQIVDITY